MSNKGQKARQAIARSLEVGGDGEDREARTSHKDAKAQEAKAERRDAHQPSNGGELRDGYGKRIVPPHVKAVMGDESILNDSTKVKSVYEQAMKELLIEFGVANRYEAAAFELTKGDAWPPDFFSLLFVGGRQVIFETHNVVGAKYKARMSKFEENQGEFFYLIIVKSRIHDGSQSVAVVGPRGEHGVYADELWEVPHIRTTRARVDGKWVQEPNPEDYARWKRDVRRFLKEFIEKRADKIEGDGAKETELKKMQRGEE